MKKFICAVFTFVSILFFSFGQSAEELEKIDLVLSKMSARARKEISILNKEEFIQLLDESGLDYNNLVTKYLNLSKGD